MKRILIAGLIGLTAACTGTTGTPAPAPTNGEDAATSGSNSSDLKAVKPCDLLTVSEAAGLGYRAPGTPEKVGTSDGCAWKGPDSARTRAGVRADAGVKDLNAQGDKVSETTTGKFSATRVAPNGARSQCTILISVTETSSVTVISTFDVSSEDTATSCERAAKAADLVAAKLP